MKDGDTRPNEDRDIHPVVEQGMPLQQDYSGTL